MSFAYIGNDEGQRITKLLSSLFGIVTFLRLLFIFDAAIFSTKFGPIINWCGHAHRSFEVGLNVDIRQMKNRSVL